MSSKVIESLKEAREAEAYLMAEAESLQARLQEVQTQILLNKGAIQALESLIDGSVPSGFMRHRGGLASVSNTTGRSSRSTKEEMRERRRVVARLLFEKGGSTVSDLLPEVVERLGRDIKPHNLRNVLKKFESDFVRGEEHGVWLLSEDARERYAYGSEDELESESESETT